MPTLPAELLPLIVEFAPLFSKQVWEHAKILIIGAILAIGKRTVTACLRVTGKSEEAKSSQPLKSAACIITTDEPHNVGGRVSTGMSIKSNVGSGRDSCASQQSPVPST